MKPDLPLRLLLVLALVAQAAAGARAQTSTTFDKATPGDATSVDAPGSQRSPRLARGGTGTLMVWADERSKIGSLLDQSGVDVYAQRLDDQGQPTGDGPFVVTDEFGTQTAPQVVWNGSHWLVAWTSQVQTPFFFAWTVKAVRVAPDGTVVDATPITVPFEDTTSVGFDLTLLGANWMVLTQGSSSGNTGLFGTRIAPDGTLVDASPVQLVAPGVGLFFGVDAEGTATRLVVAYQSGSSFSARLFDTNLAAVGATFSVPGTRFASNGSDFYLTWSTGTNVVGSPMDTSGNLAHPSGVVLTPSASVLAQPFSGSMNWSGSVWWIGWQHAIQGIQLRRVRPDGTALGPIVTVDAANESDHGPPVVAALPTGGVQIAWQDIDGAEWNVLGQRVLANGTSLPFANMVQGTAAHSRTELATGPNGTALLTARSESATENRALAWPLDRFGNALSDPITVASGANIGAPAAAWNGQQWLVAWADAGQILARRYDAGLSPIDASPFLVMPGFSADVAALGDDFLVVGTEFGSSIQLLFPYAVRVDGPTGAVLDPTPIQLGNNFAQLPRVVTCGGRWLVAWQRNFSHDDRLASIESCFVDSNGVNSSVNVPVFSSGGRPDLASDGSQALIAWRTGTLASADTDIRGRLIDASGNFVGSDFLVSGASGKQRDPAVAWNGAHFVVTWEDLRDAAAFFDERTALYGARVDSNGNVLDPSGFPIAADGAPIIDPALMASDGDVVVAAARFDTTPGRLSYRAITRRIGHWTDEGEALAGPSGTPRLDALGERAIGSTATFQVSEAPGSALGWLVLGSTRSDTPIAGGLLVPTPDLLVAFATGPLGRYLVDFTFPAVTVPPGSSLFMQAWILDPAAPQFVVASQAVAHTAP